MTGCNKRRLVTNIGNIGGFDIFAVPYGTSGCEVTGNKYIVTDTKYSETIDFSMLLDNNDILLENNTEMDAIPENLEAMILNPELASHGSSPIANNVIYCVIAALAAIVISAIMWLIIAKARKH